MSKTISEKRLAGSLRVRQNFAKIPQAIDIPNLIEIQKKSMELEKIIQINIISTHGLAFKKEYKNSWRSDGKNNLHNILDF